ncbi:ShlB/FhaC/HecB family hemolysin secretion/activation protein [Polynucleobacter paneuropaeus]|nr:ShlB/FhaC/HecB family hemolysin secretion/activation protein [Polynucleobacter paneuropaeus]
MKLVFIRPALLAGLFFLSQFQAYAQSPDAGALQQGIQRQLEAGQMQAPPEPFVKEKTPSPTAPSKNQTLIDVKGFNVKGMTIVTEAEAQEVLAPFKNRKLTLTQINEAANAIVDLYQKKGRIAQAVVPPQEIKDGMVEIKVIEGKVGAIIIDPAFEEDPPRLSSKVTTKFLSYSNPVGGLIDLDGLERSLSLINEIPSIRAEGSLEPGKDDGTTDIRVKVDELSRFSGNVSLTNYGSSSTGSGQAVLSLGLNDLMGIGDGGTIDVIGSAGSIFGQVRYFIPANADGLRIGIGGSTLSYNTLSQYTPLYGPGASGSANTGGFYSTYALERTARSNKTVSFNLENKTYINYGSSQDPTLVNQGSQEIQNYTINSATLGLQGNQFVGNASWIWSANVIYGSLHINNTLQLAQDSGNLNNIPLGVYQSCTSVACPYGQNTGGGYGKITIASYFNQPLPIKDVNFLFSFNGQIANKNLNSAEQFYLGGPYGVRAYPVTQGGGAQGAVASIELNHTYKEAFKFGAFFDAGVVQQNKSLYQNWQYPFWAYPQTAVANGSGVNVGNPANAGNTYALYGTGLNATYTHKKTEITGTIAYRVGSNPLLNSNGQQVNVNGYASSVQLWIKGSLYF